MKLSKTIHKIFVLMVAGMICLGLSGQAAAQQTPLPELMERARKAGLEQPVLDELQARAEERGISSQQLASIIESAASLAEDNLPFDHLTQKALEGFSKGVPGPRIVSYIDRMGSATRQASDIVDPWVENEQVQQMIDRSGESVSGAEMRVHMIKVSSKAIAQNISAGTVEQILSGISDESVLSQSRPSAVIAAVSILPDLPGAEQTQVARAFVVRALKSGFNAGELQKLPTAFNMAQKRSQLPAASILEGVSSQMRGGIPASQILQNLFNGDIGGGPPGNIPKGLENVPDRGRGSGGPG